jgi:uracil-DNA glycosylase family 4
MSDIIVPGVGAKPCRWMIVGERPGRTEAQTGIPFSGVSGDEQDLFLSRNSLHRSQFYITNVCKDYVEGDPDPTRADIDRWSPVLEQELSDVRPLFIITAGRYATRWFLGDVDMDAVHGTPHLSPRAPGATVIPVYHPAYGLYDPDAKGIVFHDYSQAAKILKGKIPATPVRDGIEHPRYEEITYDRRFRHECEGQSIIAIDTEGTPDSPWSLQFSFNPGTGHVLRTANPIFRTIAAQLAYYIREVNPLVVVHNTMYDLEMMRAMGVDLRGARLYDTMVAAYLLRLEPQSLKQLARRHCGMVMSEYMEVIGDAADAKREAYLWSVLEREWPKPEPRVIVENDLTTRVYKPQPVDRRVEQILIDWDTARDNLRDIGRLVVKSDAKEEFDAAKRWRGVDDVLRGIVEREMGPFPDATLDDIPLGKAILYSGRDPDATLRVYHRIAPMVNAAGLDDRMHLIMSNLPAIEEMQSTGLLASRPHFEGLVERMNGEMEALCSKLSSKFNDGQPINPNSGDQVAALMKRRGLKGLKKSKKTKKMSTSKKSIEHLRFEDEAIGIVEDWRERGKTRDSFGLPILERIPEGVDVAPIRCNIRVTRVSSSRLSATDPPLLAIPVRHQLGLDVRRGFVAPTAANLVRYYGVAEADAVDCYLGTWDMSQIEMRVMAHLSGDPFLCQLFHERRDIHAETAIRIFGLADIREWNERKGEYVYPSVKKMEHRNPTKRAGFGVITGIQGLGLLDQLRMMGCEGWDEDKCDELIAEWFKVYPGVDRFLGECRSTCRDRGFVRDMGGMYRYLPGIWSRDSRIAAEAGRQSHSHIIQGSAQWMIQRAMSWLGPQINSLRDSSGLFARWLLQIHDELIFAFAQPLQTTMHDLVMEALTQHSYPLRVPVEANGAYALTWGDLEK